MQQKRTVNSRKRLPLGEISQRISQSKNWTSMQQKNIKQLPSKQNLNQQEVKRLEELKNKYKKLNNQNFPQISKIEQEQVLFVIKQKAVIQNSLQSSFTDISIPVTRQINRLQRYINNSQDFENFNKESSSVSTKSWCYREDFQRKIQESEIRIQTKIEGVERKIKKLKDLCKSNLRQAEDCLTEQKSLKRQGANSNCSDKKFSFEKSEQLISKVSLKTQEKQNGSKMSKMSKIDNKIQSQNYQEKNNYIKKLKSMNFVEEIKRKIQQIQQQKKSNLQKKLSSVTSLSQISSHSQKNFEHSASEPEFQQQIKQPYCLARLVTSLAQSQVIQTTDRDRLTNKDAIKSYESTVLQNYKFVTAIPASYKYPHNQIIQQPQKEQMPIKASPSLNKSIYKQVFLDETQVVQRNELQGDFGKIDERIQKQFTLLINRLAYQAEIDNNLACDIFRYQNTFTSKQNLKTLIVNMIRQYCQQNNLPLNESMLEVSQMQIDPLVDVKKSYQDLSNKEIEKIAYRLKRDCDRNCSYFKNKIFKCFREDTVDFFIDQLKKWHSLSVDEEFNVGHLTSYINMRTGKNLRNRFLYRILKRSVKNPSSGSLSRENLLDILVVNKSI